MISTDRSPATGIGTVIPHFEESEVAVLDAMLNDPDWRSKILDKVRSEYFVSPDRRVVYSVARRLISQGYEPDLIAVRDELDRQGRLDDTINLMGILRQMEGLPHRLDVDYHIERVCDAYTRRALMQAGERLTRKASDLSCSIDDAREMLEAAIRITSDDGDTGFMGEAAESLELVGETEPDWLVERVLTMDEPTIFAAGSKCCKSLQMIELAVSLVTQTDFMRQRVPKARRVLYLGGESNRRQVSRQLRKALKSRGLTFSDLGERLHVETVSFPQLISPDDMRRLARAVKEGRFDVVAYDPLYRGSAGLDTYRLDEAGPALKQLQAACHPACLIVSHHITKPSARELGQPPRLEDITGGFAAQVFGQWWLVCRNEKYQFDGIHDLSVTFGGREGQAGGRRIVFDENAWTWQVESLSDYIEASQQERAEQSRSAKAKREQGEDNIARNGIIAAMRSNSGAMSKAAIETASGVQQSRFRRVFAEMQRSGEVAQSAYVDSLKRTKEGWILSEGVR